MHDGAIDAIDDYRPCAIDPFDCAIVKAMGRRRDRIDEALTAFVSQRILAPLLKVAVDGTHRVNTY